jgi:tripartite-type tricarboxylate transporter receptor subunit TctC
VTAEAKARPTVAEGGLEGFVASSWCMLLAPAGTPQSVVDRLSTEVGRIVGGEHVGGGGGASHAGAAPCESARG